MSGYFRRLAARAQGLAPMLAPRPPSRFEDGGVLPAWEESAVPSVMPGAAGPTVPDTAVSPLARGPLAPSIMIPRIAADRSAAPAPLAPLAIPPAMAAPVATAPLRAARREASAVNAAPSPAAVAAAEPQGILPIERMREAVPVAGLESAEPSPREAPARPVPSVSMPPGRLPPVPPADGSARTMPRQAAAAVAADVVASVLPAPQGATPASWRSHVERGSPAARPAEARDAAAATPDTEISIGRVEIRFAAPPTPAAPVRAAGPPSLATLLATSRRARPP